MSIYFLLFSAAKFEKVLKKIIYIAAGIIFIFLLDIVYLYYSEPDKTKLNFVHRYLLDNTAEKWEQKISTLHKEDHAIADYEMLMQLLNPFEKSLVNRIFAINPASLGFKGPFYSKEKPLKLIKINSIKVGSGEDERETGIQYYTGSAYADYLRMTEQMKKDLGRRLYIDSGYRSPGRQAYLFIKYLVTYYNYNLGENAKWIAMPGYSEHGSPIKTAMDLTNEDGINGFTGEQTAEDVEELPEYKWMLENAGRYNFYLSYPRGNPYGVSFEPWHWHWNGGERK